MTVTLLISLLILSPPHVVSTEIHGSVEASMARKLPVDGPPLAAQIARLLKWKGDIIRNIHPGDQLRIAYAPGEVPELQALYYKGLQIKLEAYAVDDGAGIPRFYDAEGTLVEPHIQKNPVPKYVQITDVLQRGRGKRKHQGVDFKAPAGTPIKLPYSGVVSRVNWLRKVNGNCVEVEYRDGNFGRFLHLKQVDRGVKPGRRLSAGTPLGTVGSTGRSGAPHLHYEIRSSKGKMLDPLKYHGTRKGKITRTRRGHFERARNQYRALLNIPRR